MRFRSKWNKIVTLALPVLILLIGCVLFIRYQQGRYVYTTAMVTEVYSDHFNFTSTVKLPDGTSDTEKYSVYSNQCKKVQNQEGQSIRFSDIATGDKVTVKSNNTVLTISPQRFEKIYLITIEHT